MARHILAIYCTYLICSSHFFTPHSWANHFYLVYLLISTAKPEALRGQDQPLLASISRAHNFLSIVGTHCIQEIQPVHSEGQPWDFFGGNDVLVAQSCLTLCDPTDYSLPGFSAHGILQARILEWVAILFSGDPGIEPGSPALPADSLQSFWGRLSSWGAVHEW